MDKEPLINPNTKLQSYYQSLESRIGYRFMLGGTRHFGYYDHDSWWPFPLNGALRAMEDRMAESLNLPSGAYVLDAGCGVGHVAIHLARKYGLKIFGIDIVQHHLDKANRNIARTHLPNNQITVRRMDYHHLESIASATFDGIYTMETFVHATEPEAVLSGFFRTLRPGGHISMFEYDHELNEGGPEDLARSMREVNDWSAMPTNDRSHPGVFKQMLEDAGFTDVVVRDYSENIKPITRFFYVVGYIPFLIITLLGLERYFINTVAGVQMHRGHGHWHYVAISAKKPGELGDVGRDR
ncbi:hypothetical protein PISL3812_08391 [Talaromyces islandicus]|uniref:Methyltransferase domain-containing protein n=1 Tax=Talaromyces islandicus TaxID=28573 RepID=A0A0U1M6U6_TALIS|nr:hypothetical protein PISL3812_08391 [Talaromyces islandicus]